MYGFTIALRRNKYNKRSKKKSDTDRIRRRTSETKAKKPKIKFSKFLPMIFLVFAVIAGVVFSGEQPTESAQENVSVSKKSIDCFVLPEDEYSFYYVPVVINSIEEYGEKDEVSDGMIAACCWSLLADKDSKEKYEVFDEKTVIPEKDVNERAQELFGKKIKFENRSVNINGCKFEFNGSDYTIETTGMTPTFLPKLLKLESESGKVTLTVGCLKNDEYVQDSNGNTVEPDPSKKLRFILKGDGDDLYISSIEQIE